MNRKFFIFNTLFLLLTTLYLVLTASKVEAQAAPSLNIVCLEATYCGNKDACEVQHGHRMKLTSGDEKAVVNSKTYIMECIDVDLKKADGTSGTDGVPEPYCTTGNSALDLEVVQSDNFTILQKAVGYSISRSDSYGVHHLENGQLVKKVPPTTVMTDSFGNIVPNHLEWQSYTDKSLERKFVAMNLVGPAKSEGDSGALGGQQQADLGYRIKVKASSCGGRSWDPYGRVFDAVSLEPIPNARVALNMYDGTTFTQAKANEMNLNITNPFNVNEAGRFTFVVVDGDYTLTPNATGYNHPSMDLKASIPQNVNKIYSNLYFNNSDPIKQRGVIQQRDIPMQPSGNIGKSYPLKVLTFNDNKVNNTEVFEGKVSHPFAQAQVKICDATNSCRDFRTFTSASGGPDKEGNFRIVLDLSTLKAGEKYQVTFNKVNLAADTLTHSPIQKTIDAVAKLFGKLVGVVHAQDTGDSITMDLEPIPSYLEGYAYDAEGNIMSNAIVKIYVPMSKRPFYQIETDEKGYYKLTSDFLPSTTYSIAYESQDGKEVKYSTSQVLAQNKEFIEAEKINNYATYTAQTDPRRTVTPSYVPSQKISVIPTIEVSPTVAVAVSQAPVQQETEGEQNPLFLIGAILLLLVATAGTLLAVYLYRKRMHEPTDLNQ